MRSRLGLCPEAQIYYAAKYTIRNLHNVTDDVLQEGDLWHNFEYENEQVTNKEKSHSYIHHFPGRQKEIQILFMKVKLSIQIKNIFWNLYKLNFLYFKKNMLIYTEVTASKTMYTTVQGPTAMAPVIGGELLQVDVVEVTAMSLRLVAVFVAG